VVIAIFGKYGVRNFTDRHIDDGTDVIIDQVQNWFPILMTQDAQYSIVKFTRKLKACSNQSIAIETGTPHVIYSWGTNFALNGDIGYHGGMNRSSQSVPLINRLNKNVMLDMSEIETFDFLSDRTLYSTYSTEYYCQIFKLPQSVLNVKRHVLRVSTKRNFCLSVCDRFINF
jgi:alpha-tubulin suppressor-like RCC1 family protein